MPLEKFATYCQLVEPSVLRTNQKISAAATWLNRLATSQTDGFIKEVESFKVDVSLISDQLSL